VSPDGRTILFGLPGVGVRHVEHVAHHPLRGSSLPGTPARLVHVVTIDPTAAFCPACGVVSSSVRQRRTTSPRDVPYGEERLAVRWHKVQSTCRERRCPRKAFTEQIAELPAGARLTHRLRRQVGDGQAVSVAGAGLMSWPIAHASFIVHAQALLTEPTAVTVLGIDETRRGRPRWTRCETTSTWVKLERFETNFVDLSGPAGPTGAGFWPSQGQCHRLAR